MIFKVLETPELGDKTGGAIAVAGRKQQLLLAALLIRANNWVSSRWLIEVLWAETPPRSAGSNLKTYIWELRQVVPPVPDGSGRIESRRGEYRIVATETELDLLARADLMARGREAAQREDFDTATDLLGQAIALWSGEFGEVIAESAALALYRSRLFEEHWTLLEQWIEMQLRAGRHTEAVPELRGLLIREPLRERLWSQLVLALYRSGRRAEALTAYQEARQILDREMGIAPGPELRQLHLDVLRDNPNLLPPEPPRHEPPAWPAPLPVDRASWTGRHREVADVLALRDQPEGRPRTPVGAIVGMPGVGKTALAVHAAHQLLPHYPDGALFLDLHGFTEGLDPVDPADAVGRMLLALGVPSERIPRVLDDRSAMYRSTLTGRRMLILLDNAAEESQVTPLIPAEPGCLVLITTRRRLTGLDDIHPVALDVLPLPDAIALFARVAGEQYATLEPDATREIVSHCGLLPLAIRIAAARLRARPTWTAAHLAKRLSDQQHLAELEAGQRSVAAAFQVSYDHLAADQMRMFWRLSLHPGTDVESHAAAALADLPPRRADKLLESLVDLHLLVPVGTQRYQFHDLIRKHAQGIAASAEDAPSRDRAIRRLLDYWLYTASQAASLLGPAVPLPSLGYAPKTFEGAEDAMDWLRVERRNLVTGVRYAAAHGLHMHTLNLALSLTRLFLNAGYLSDWIAAVELAVAAARELDDREGLIEALLALCNAHLTSGDNTAANACLNEALELSREIGRSMEARVLGRASLVALRMGKCSESYAHGQRALRLSEEIGDLADQAQNTLMLALALLRLGRYHSAREHASRALDLYDALGDPTGCADAINVIGLLHFRLGETERAFAHGRRSLLLYQDSQYHRGQAYARNLLGSVCCRLRCYTDAMDHLAAALSISRRLGDQHTEAHTLHRMGIVHREQQHYDDALACQEQALELARASGDVALECEILNDTGQTWHAVGDAGSALYYLQESLKHADVAGDPYERARAHKSIASSLVTIGEDEAAAQHRRAALDGFAELGVPDLL